MNKEAQAGVTHVDGCGCVHGDYAVQYCAEAAKWSATACRLAKRIAEIQKLSIEKADDPGLWFNAVNASEAYLQAAIRELSAAIEGIKLPNGSVQYSPEMAQSLMIARQINEAEGVNGHPSPLTAIGAKIARDNQR